MVKINFNYKNRKINIEAKNCNGLWRGVGLMFSRRERAEILFFEFEKNTRQAIHSFFCPEFVAIWLDEQNKVVEVKKIYPWTFSIIPSRSFKKLIEIPINKKNKNILELINKK